MGTVGEGRVGQRTEELGESVRLRERSCSCPGTGGGP